MHGIDVGFGKDRGGSGDCRGNEDLAKLANFAKVTCLGIPLNICDETGPPEALSDVGFGGEEGFVSYFIMASGKNVETSIGKGMSLCAPCKLLCHN